MEEELLHILETKPPTPPCVGENEYGLCLVWTKEEGWTVHGSPSDG